MISSIKETYKSKLSHYQNELEILKKRSTTVSILRLAEFIVGAILVYYATLLNLAAVFVVIILTISVLLILVKYYNELDKKKKYLQQIININSNELKALEGKYLQFEDGNEFSDPEHPFTYDLDLFGEGSLFQFFNRSCTIQGKNKLASWLKSPFKSKEEIINQQKAIDELSSELNWRQDFQATGNLFDDRKEDKEILNDWFNSPVLFAGNISFTVLGGF